MDYNRLAKAGEIIFGSAGVALVCISLYRCVNFSSIRLFYLIDIQLIVMGTIMILMGFTFLRLIRLINLLRGFFGKGLYCLFVAGFMDMAIRIFKQPEAIVCFVIFVIGLMYFTVGIIFVKTEIDILKSYRG